MGSLLGHPGPRTFCGLTDPTAWPGAVHFTSLRECGHRLGSMLGKAALAQGTCWTGTLSSLCPALPHPFLLLWANLRMVRKITKCPLSFTEGENVWLKPAPVVFGPPLLH